jgi:hypothetical protein
MVCVCVKNPEILRCGLQSRICSALLAKVQNSVLNYRPQFSFPSSTIIGSQIRIIVHIKTRVLDHAHRAYGQVPTCCDHAAMHPPPSSHEPSIWIVIMPQPPTSPVDLLPSRGWLFILLHPQLTPPSLQGLIVHPSESLTLSILSWPTIPPGANCASQWVTRPCHPQFTHDPSRDWLFIPVSLSPFLSSIYPRSLKGLIVYPSGESPSLSILNWPTIPPQAWAVTILPGVNQSSLLPPLQIPGAASLTSLEKMIMIIISWKEEVWETISVWSVLFLALSCEPSGDFVLHEGPQGICIKVRLYSRMECSGSVSFLYNFFWILGPGPNPDFNRVWFWIRILLNFQN